MDYTIYKILGSPLLIYVMLINLITYLVATTVFILSSRTDYDEETQKELSTSSANRRIHTSLINWIEKIGSISHAFVKKIIEDHQYLSSYSSLCAIAIISVHSYQYNSPLFLLMFPLAFFLGKALDVLGVKKDKYTWIDGNLYLVGRKIERGSIVSYDKETEIIWEKIPHFWMVIYILSCFWVLLITYKTIVSSDFSLALTIAILASPMIWVCAIVTISAYPLNYYFKYKKMLTNICIVRYRKIHLDRWT